MMTLYLIENGDTHALIAARGGEAPHLDRAEALTQAQEMLDADPDGSFMVYAVQAEHCGVVFNH